LNNRRELSLANAAAVRGPDLRHANGGVVRAIAVANAARRLELAVSRAFLEHCHIGIVRAVAVADTARRLDLAEGAVGRGDTLFKALDTETHGQNLLRKKG
jgi:hypothetical protein